MSETSRLVSFAARTVAELVEIVRGNDRIDVPLLAPGAGLSFSELRGNIRHDVADGVVSFLAGTSLTELNEVLAKDDRCIPYQPVWPQNVDSITALILLGLPHGAEGRWGSWRDWILGATMVTADGTIVKSGSRVVKSVAGYDAHKLLVGSRGTLLLPAEINLRTYHISAASFPHPPSLAGEKVRSITRVLSTDLQKLLGEMGEEVLWSDEATGTVWSSGKVQDWVQFKNSWSIDPFSPSVSQASLDLQRRAKSVLDPTDKLAPGVFHNLVAPLQ